MNKTTLILYLISTFLFTSCVKNELLRYAESNPNRPFYEPSPFGMSYIERGSFVIGQDDEVINESTPAKRVSIESFWMDETEITNNEYRQFVYWVRDSIARQMLSETFPEFMVSEDEMGNFYDEPKLNWLDPIEWNNLDFQTALYDLYIPDEEQLLYYNHSVDARKLIYDYYWIDYAQAAKKGNSYNFETQSYQGNVLNNEGETIPVVSRSSFIMRESTPVYPDTLCWVRDYTFSYNEPMTSKYFWHVAFDEYPVVGVTWDQAKAFCNWRTKTFNEYQQKLGEIEVHDYRLPTEAEWEYAARGGHERTLYPWGSYYLRNQMGCFIANFKPRRGNYVADSNNSTSTIAVASFEPNDKRLYDMAGNVAEWTNTAFYESAYDIISDFNPSIEYNASPDDPPVLKRKVIRGGSWKDVAYYLRNGTRSYEYQDSAKSYIGFRCVKTSFRDEYIQ